MKKLLCLLLSFAFLLCVACAPVQQDSANDTNTPSPTLPEAPAETPPPAEAPPPAETPPVKEPPAAEEPPIEAPPVDTPPVEEPPAEELPEPRDSDFVPIRDYITDISIDLRYATENNFTGQVIYDFSEPYLRYGTVKKLLAVQEELAAQGYRLLVWDAFRPPAAQFTLWEVCPDPVYVSNPNNGFSSHSRGNTVDITLLFSDGTAVTMPTEFDDFSTLADRDYSDVSAEAAANALLLENTMKAHGFKAYSGEWWHFTDTVSYDVEMDFIP